MLDVVVQPLAPLASTSDTPSRVRVTRGGSGANLAVAMRAVLAPTLDVAFVGVVGEDDAAHLVRADLERCGVVAHLRRAPGTTGVVVAMVSESGERAMLSDRGVNSSLRFEDVDAWMDESLAHLHISGYTILDPQTRAVVPRLFARAHEWGASTSVDVCSVAPLRQLGAEGFHAVARAAHTLFANEEEALALTATTRVEDALDVLARTWSEVVVTRGERGALVRHDGREYSAPSYVARVVDTTGAGDGATGTYLGERLNGRDIDSSLARAMAAAARVVQGLGNRGDALD